jgi:hypothetical protein
VPRRRYRRSPQRQNRRKRRSFKAALTAYTQAHNLCIELKAIEPAPEGKRLVRVEDENGGKKLVTNQPPRDGDAAAEGNDGPEGEAEGEPEGNAAATVRATKRIAPAKANAKIFIVEAEVKQRYSTKALEKARKELLHVLEANNFTGIGIRLECL